MRNVLRVFTGPVLALLGVTLALLPRIFDESPPCRCEARLAPIRAEIDALGLEPIDAEMQFASRMLSTAMEAGCSEHVNAARTQFVVWVLAFESMGSRLTAIESRMQQWDREVQLVLAAWIDAEHSGLAREMFFEESGR